jgi:hypothetical protein
MTGRRVGMPFILSTPTLALRFRQNNGPTPSGDYQPSRSLLMKISVLTFWGTIVNVDHATLNRWVIRYSPTIAVKATSQKRETNRSWRMDFWKASMFFISILKVVIRIIQSLFSDSFDHYTIVDRGHSNQLSGRFGFINIL